MRRDILEELEEATMVSLEKRELERRCGNAHAEIVRLRAEVARLNGAGPEHLCMNCEAPKSFIVGHYECLICD